MAQGFLGKHTLDATFGQFRQLLKYLGKRRGVFVDEVDHRGTSPVCPNCRAEVRFDESVWEDVTWFKAASTTDESQVATLH